MRTLPEPRLQCPRKMYQTEAAPIATVSALENVLSHGILEILRYCLEFPDQANM